MSEPINIQPALVLGCNTPHGINVLSDYIEEKTGHPLDFHQSNWSDGNDIKYGFGSGFGYGDMFGGGYGDGHANENGDGNGGGKGDGIGNSTFYMYIYDDKIGNGHGSGYGVANGDGYGNKINY